MRLACALTWWLIVLAFPGFSTSQEKPTTEKVSAGVAQQNLIKKVEPVYPQMDRVSIEGKVVLDVIISREGNVESIKVISGHPMLFQSAMDAVKQWRYKPFLLNGQPIEVDILVEVPFSLKANAGLSASQESRSALRISAATAEQNLIKKVEPVYPHIAKEAHVEGRVIISVTISATGKINSQRAISGHPVLIQSAMDAVRQWEYQPYILEGKARTVTAMVRVPFSLGHMPEKDPAFTAYDEQETKCQALLDQQSYASAQDACASLPKLAEKADFDTAAAYGLSGLAYFKASNFQEALVAWRHQLAISKDYPFKINPGEGEAHFNVARALQATGDLNGARSHYESAMSRFEAAHNDALDVTAYSERLRTVLLSYASLLRQMGKKSDAEALERKAEAIKPDSQKN